MTIDLKGEWIIKIKLVRRNLCVEVDVSAIGAMLMLIAACLSAAIPVQTARGATFTTLHSFCAESNCPDGALPAGALVQATDGHLYGSTFDGGIPSLQAGTIFKLTLGGALTTLYSFCSKTNCADGEEPNGGLIQATDGSLYGTTYVGTTSGGGTVFKLTPSGTLTTLYTFCSKADCEDGAYPQGSLWQAADGDFYGTTVGGGANREGTIFKITPSGIFKQLYSFCSESDCADGRSPSPLIQMGDGSFYGTTAAGGTNGAGTVFKFKGDVLTTLYSFCSGADCPDGTAPSGAVLSVDGVLYGSASGGGAHGRGTVFSITTGGALTTLYSFCPETNCPDGVGPNSSLILATNNKLYGTTESGGTRNRGTAFQITRTGKFTVVHNFGPQVAGTHPFNGLMQATNGDLFGATASGGSSGQGTLFSLSLNLGPFVEPEPPPDQWGR